MENIDLGKSTKRTFGQMAKIEAFRRNLIDHEPLFRAHIDRERQFELIEEPVNEK